MATPSLDICQFLNEDFGIDLEPEVYPPALPQSSPSRTYLGGHGGPLAGSTPRGSCAPGERPDRTPNLWDPRLTIDIATGLDALPDILTRYDLTHEAFERLSDTPAFRKELAMAMREVRENGLAFPKKCATQAELYLERLDQLVYDAATPASTILSIVTWMAKMAGLEPKESKSENQNNTQINVSISF